MQKEKVRMTQGSIVKSELVLSVAILGEVAAKVK